MLFQGCKFRSIERIVWKIYGAKGSVWSGSLGFEEEGQMLGECYKMFVTNSCMRREQEGYGDERKIYV